MEEPGGHNEPEAPRLLFTVPEPMDGLPTYWKNISRDGQRFVFALDVPESSPAR
ncbi:MAG: hypothetical protein O7G86_20275 [Gammaproteobacteria bacterium]|nr:hypothetical protein [Gammaproteobacteria bacterium]